MCANSNVGKYRRRLDNDRSKDRTSPASDASSKLFLVLWVLPFAATRP